MLFDSRHPVFPGSLRNVPVHVDRLKRLPLECYRGLVDRLEEHQGKLVMSDRRRRFVQITLLQKVEYMGQRPCLEFIIGEDWQPVVEILDVSDAGKGPAQQKGPRKRAGNEPLTLKLSIQIMVYKKQYTALTLKIGTSRQREHCSSIGIVKIAVMVFDVPWDRDQFCPTCGGVGLVC